MTERVPTRVAAREIGVALDTLCYYMEIGKWDLGEVMKSKTGRQNRHIVFRSKLDRFLGKDGKNEEQELGG